MNSHKRNLEYIKKLSDFFREFSALTSLYELDAVSCIERISLMPGFSALKLLSHIKEAHYPGCNLRELWKDSVYNFSGLPFYMNEVKELLMSFSDALGKYSREDFSSKCLAFADKIQEIYEREKSKWEKNRSLHLGAGLFTAAAVFIIFI